MIYQRHRPMNEKPPNSLKPSIQKLLDSHKQVPLSEVELKPRTAYQLIHECRERFGGW